MGLDLFYTADNADLRDIVARKLERTFGLGVIDRGILPIIENARSRQRRQYDAYLLLDHLARCMRSEMALWIVSQDIYCENVNFVFGLAMYHIAAVVSTSRLDSPEMVGKEAAHEVGHVMGLQHCRNNCVMRFSNTYEDALQKPGTLCASCQRRLDRKIVEPGLQM